MQRQMGPAPEPTFRKSLANSRELYEGWGQYFGAAVRILDGLISTARKTRDSGALEEEIEMRGDRLRAALERLRCPVALAGLKDMTQHLSGQPAADLLRNLETIRDNLGTEFGTDHWLHLDDEDSRLYSRMVSPHVDGNSLFLGLPRDYSEAVKCCATQHYAASIWHILRCYWTMLTNLSADIGLNLGGVYAGPGDLHAAIRRAVDTDTRSADLDRTRHGRVLDALQLTKRPLCFATFRGGLNYKREDAVEAICLLDEAVEKLTILLPNGQELN